MGYRATFIAVLLGVAACGSSSHSNDTGDASLLGTGGTAYVNGSGGTFSGSGGTGTNGTGTGTGTGTGGTASNGTGGSGTPVPGTGGMGFPFGTGGAAAMFMCPATQPMDGAMCMPGGGGFFGRSTSCPYGNMTCRCRRSSGTWTCAMPMMPPTNDDGGVDSGNCPAQEPTDNGACPQSAGASCHYGSTTCNCYANTWHC
jgi:hypothetical protein